MSQRIAVVGSGIAGLSAAWWLSRRHEVTLFERDNRLGGHTHTHTFPLDGREVSVDTGFIVFNPQHYPLLTALFEELGVRSRPTTMSFSVSDEGSGLEYAASSLDGLFCQRRNLISPRFWGMLRDLRRFYREAPALLDDPDAAPDEGPSLGEYLQAGRYGDLFVRNHLVPMASALWSSPAQHVLAFPTRYLIRFLANHHMLKLCRRAPWRVVDGGSSRYIEAMRQRWNVQVRSGCPVRAVRRQSDGVRIATDEGIETFDHVVMACHSDQALALLADADRAEREVLGAIHYQPNEVVLHTDERLLPRNRKAWAAWNAHVSTDPWQPCTVSYCMNLLQGIDSQRPLVVTLNRRDLIRPEHVLRVMQYAHPVLDHLMVRAQGQRGLIQGQRRTWFAGAYWGWGFHEDGIRSARDMVQAFEASLHAEPRQQREAATA